MALRPPSHAISADFVCALRATVEPQVGAPLLFAQGAAGNLVPIGPEMEMEERLELTGKVLGTEALRVYFALGAEALPVDDSRSTEALRAYGPPESLRSATPAPPKPVLAAASEDALARSLDGAAAHRRRGAVAPNVSLSDPAAGEW